MLESLRPLISKSQLAAFFMAACAFFFSPTLKAADAQTVQDVLWSVWHEGCPVFAMVGDEMRPIGEVRGCIYKVQADHNMDAANRIASLNDEELAAILVQGEGDITRTMLIPNFVWVCNHESQLNSFRILASQRGYAQIREIYERLQKDNPNARHLMAAVRNRTIKGMLDQIH